MGLLSGVDGSGQIVPGVAVDVAPIWLFVGRDSTLQDWRDHWGLQAASHLTLSFATSTLPSTETGSGAAVALRWVIVDDSDPRFDDKLAECVKSSLGTAEPDPETVPTSGDVPVEHKKVPSITACKDEARKRSDDRGLAASVAAAYSGAAASGKWKDVESRAFDGWVDANYGVSVGQSGSIAFGVAGRLRRFDSERRSSADVGLELRVSLWGSFRLSASSAWKPQDLSNVSESKDDVAAGGKAEVRVYDDAWASVAATYEGGNDAPVSGTLVLGGLQYAF